MSLKAQNLEHSFCQEYVCIRNDLLKGVDFRNFLCGLLSHNLVHSVATEIKKCYTDFNLPLDMPAGILVSLIYGEFTSRLKSDDLVVYYLFDPIYQCVEPLLQVDFSVRNNDFLTLFNDERVAAIVVRRGDVSIRSVSLVELSPYTRQIFESHCGYHTDDGERLSLQTFEEKLNFETVELGNTDIYAFLSKVSQKVADLKIPLNCERVSPSVARYFNRQILEILETDFGMDMTKCKCCWVSPSVEALKQVYITPFKDYTPGILTVKFSEFMTCVTDLGIEGALIIADDISLEEFHGGDSE